MGKKKRETVCEPESSAPCSGTAETIDFDTWFTLREPKLPKHHLKEIIRADFNGQGIGAKETPETFDAALRRYGLTI